MLIHSGAVEAFVDLHLCVCVCFKIYFIFIYVSVHVHVSADVHRGQKRALDLMGLDL